MSIGAFALQTAIYAKLTGDSTLTDTLGVSIYDDIPENASFPYIQMGQDSISEYDVKDADGSQTTMTLHIWSQYKGAKETKNILDKLHDLLHDSDLTVSGYNFVNCRFEFADILRDPDGVTRHGVIRFRAVTLGATGA
jgi:hypothetical protein